MPQVKAAIPTKIFARDDWQVITCVSRWKGLALVAHAWLVIFAAAGLAAWSGQWWAWIIAIIIVGGRQLGLAILMHDGAHGLLHPKRSINNFVGQWLTGVPMGTDMHAYRTYHLTHHRYTQQPEDPDLALSAPFPTSSASMTRKAVRDLTGQTFFKQRSAQLKTALPALGQVLMGRARDDTRPPGGDNGPLSKKSAASQPEPADTVRTVFAAKVFLRFIVAQLVLLALSLVSGLGPWPFVIWVVAMATTFQMFLRIRNIAEHACTTTGSDDPFSHARTTRASPIARVTLAPYWVNYHSEHHLFMGVPCYSLPDAHRLLIAGGHGPRMTIAPSYWAVMKEITAAPNNAVVAN